MSRSLILQHDLSVLLTDLGKIEFPDPSQMTYIGISYATLALAKRF